MCLRVRRRRSEEAEVRLLDEAEQERRDEERRQQVQEYRAFREQVEKNREAERVERNLIKRLRLDLFEQLQVRVWRHHVTPSCLFMFSSLSTSCCHQNSERFHVLFTATNLELALSLRVFA